jgi:outer membrane lipoprotein-sorting protein
MNKNVWIIIVIGIIAALGVAGFFILQPTAADILVQSLETAETITDGHVIVSIEVDTLEQDGSGTLEIWGRHSEEGPGAFRLEVLEASEEKAQGAMIVTDGETLWAYSPSENKVFVGTPEEAQAFMETNQDLLAEYGQFNMHRKAKPEDGEYEHPESAAEAVEKLQEYVKIAKSGTETVAGETATLLKLEPIPEQMPAEYAAIGGLINLWVGKDSQLPLAISYNGGSMGEASLNILELEVNSGIDDDIFTFEIPADAEVVTFADLEPQSLSLEDAGEAVQFDFLTPSELPSGATLVDILEVQGALVQRYTLPEGGSFTVAQGLAGEGPSDMRTPSTESQSLDLRGTTGQLFESEDGDQVLLTWTEGKLFFSVAGNLTSEQALAIADSLE